MMRGHETGTFPVVMLGPTCHGALQPIPSHGIASKRCIASEHSATLRCTYSRPLPPRAVKLPTCPKHGTWPDLRFDANGVLALAWLCESEHRIVRIDEESKNFFKSLHRRFIEKGPFTAEFGYDRYGFSTMESNRKYLAELSTDAQKFVRARCKVPISNPTGVIDDGILSMAVAVHLSKKDKIDYDLKHYCA